MEERINYHLSRARAEMSLAERAASVQAARSHLDLSILHVERLRGLGCPVEAVQDLNRAYPGPTPPELLPPLPG